MALLALSLAAAAFVPQQRFFPLTVIPATPIRPVMTLEALMPTSSVHSGGLDAPSIAHHLGTDPALTGDQALAFLLLADEADPRGWVLAFCTLAIPGVIMNFVVLPIMQAADNKEA